MKKTSSKFLIVIFFVVTVLCVLSSVRMLASDAISWYCTRNKDHKQPVADPQLRIIEKYNGYYVDKKHGDSSEDKVIYLTFDAGYENGNVDKILDVMKEENVKGAFFVLGNLVLRNTSLVERMSNEGHLVCNHTNKHKDMTKVRTIEEFSSELNALEELYREKTGKEMPKYYRPPEGKFNERSLDFANKLGYKTVFWSIAYADWDNNNQMSPQKAKEKILSNIHNGAIILLHPTSKTNADIIKELIREIKAQGYRFGTLNELTTDAS